LLHSHQENPQRRPPPILLPENSKQIRNLYLLRQLARFSLFNLLSFRGIDPELLPYLHGFTVSPASCEPSG
jgi:hypothetical protein